MEEREFDRRTDEEAAAAAAEARAIGGEGGSEDLDPAERPVAEAGGGVAEGFEQAEEELIEHASHGDPAPDPGALAGETEVERSSTEYGEPDRIESTERSEEGQEGRELP